MRESIIYDNLENRVVTKLTYDATDVAEANHADRMRRGKDYKGNLVHAARIHMGDVERLRLMGYDLLSNDPAEARRALLYLQNNEPGHMSVEGKVFAEKRQAWR